MNFASLNFDTHKVVKLLQEKGFTEAQAEGFMSAMQEITLSGVATKQDLSEIQVEIQELRTEIQEFKTEMFKFQMIQTIAIIGVMIALTQFI